MQPRYLIALIALLSGLLFWLLFVWQPASETERGSTINQPPQGGDFSLQGPQGSVGLEDFRGKIVLLYFGYTWCPDICPTTLAVFSAVLNEMEEAERSKVQPIFISVDPARDTIKRLEEYSQYFHEKMIGVTGEPEVVEEVAALYGVAFRAVAPDESGNYAVDHSADSYLIDQRGQLVKRLPHGISGESLLAEIRTLL
jgi:protein SCO1/2